MSLARPAYDRLVRAIRGKHSTADVLARLDALGDAIEADTRAADALRDDLAAYIGRLSATPPAASRGTSEPGAAERAARPAVPPPADAKAAPGTDWEYGARRWVPTALGAPELSAHEHGLATGEE